MTKSKSALNSTHLALIGSIGVLLVIILSLLLTNTNTEEQTNSKPGVIVIPGAGNLNKAGDLQGNSAYSPQQSVKVQPDQLQNINL